MESSTANTITVLMQDPACSGWLRSSKAVRVLRRPDPEVAAKAPNIFVLVLASELARVADFVKVANGRRCLRGLLVHADLDLRWMGQMLDRADLRTLRNLLFHRGTEQPRRILEAWRMGAQDDLIADAVVVGDNLLVLSCALERIELPFESVPALSGLSKESRGDFAVASDGSYLHWPEPDIHLDVDTLRVVSSPQARQKAKTDLLRRSQHFGLAIATLRKEHGLRQRDIQGVSARQVRRIEGGEFFPRTETLGKLADAHGLDLAAYLDALAGSP